MADLAHAERKLAERRPRGPSSFTQAAVERVLKAVKAARGEPGKVEVTKHGKISKITVSVGGKAEGEQANRQDEQAGGANPFDEVPDYA
jgi:hypothetical protein